MIKNREKKIFEFKESHLKGKVKFQLRDGLIDVWSISLKDIQKQHINILIPEEYSITITVGGKTKILRYS